MRKIFFSFLSVLSAVQQGQASVYFVVKEKSPIKVMLEDPAFFHVQECIEFVFTNSSLK
jgi:hypothetical protein